ncbi:MAG: low temperature requirement protein A, partial [Myxococcota bacterium]
IVLGISFFRVLGELSELPLDWNTALMGGLAQLITCSLWWIYFDDVAGVQLKRGRFSSVIWVYTHLPLTVAITGLGVAIKKIVVLGATAAGGDIYRWLLCGGLSVAMLSVGMIDAVTERRQAELSDRARVNARLVSALVVLLIGWAGGFMDPRMMLSLVALVCGVQVLFDLSMVPHTEGRRLRWQKRSQVRSSQELASPGPQDQWTQGGTERRRWDVSDAIRKGAPSALRRDLYFYFMEGGWARLLVSLLLVYLLVNLIFAALYLVEPGAISNARFGSFLDAFFFSVQTLSTIGYGSMSPTSDYANTLVTLEAIVGALGVAMATGLMFAKASRPKASVLFSNVCVMNHYEGEPCLMFRVGNARGNEVVEASMRLTALKDEISPEGHRLRKLYDLALRRDTSPLFVLSWVLIHPIDEDSPLYGLDADTVEDHVVALIATMTGFDATYAHTTHARKFYYPEQFRWGHRFVDVISNLDDGRFLIDYNAFHDTEPDPHGLDGDGSEAS